MDIVVNKEKLSVDPTYTISDLMKVLNQQASSGVAVAVNNMVIPREYWERHRLIHNDSVLVVTAAQGG